MRYDELIKKLEEIYLGGDENGSVQKTFCKESTVKKAFIAKALKRTNNFQHIPVKTT